MEAIEFVGNDEAYKDWIAQHPHGFVVNTEKGKPAHYRVLHCADCSYVAILKGGEAGGFTEREYIKICAENVADLREWSIRHGRADGSFSSECTRCNPSSKPGYVEAGDLQLQQTDNVETKDWTDQELIAAISAYYVMLKKEQAGEGYNKAEVNRELREDALKNRSKGSVEMRMQNISSVLDELCLTWIDGYKPRKNVGENVKDRIKAILFDEGFVERENYESTASEDDLDKKVKALSKGKLKGKPRGTKAPKKSESARETYYRDPLVKAWVLQEAGGKCEGCGALAPFQSNDGTPYLEVHHVRLLSEGGSDTVDNAVALCPNCHRAFHYSSQRDGLLAKIYIDVERLIQE